MRILLATANPHKRDELAAVLSASAAELGTTDFTLLGIQLATLAQLDTPIPEPVEDGDTFEANAILKARHYAAAADMLCLADDSGLEVDALNGAPGVKSARYSNTTGPRSEIDLANNRLLLQNLADTPPNHRTARFVCHMALVAPPFDTPPPWLPETLRHVVAPSPLGHLIASAGGSVEGRIIQPHEADDTNTPERGRGDNGFGYDPLFLLPDRGCTTAQLSPDEKNRISHRGNAARALFAELRRLGLLDVPAK